MYRFATGDVVVADLGGNRASIGRVVGLQGSAWSPYYLFKPLGLPRTLTVAQNQLRQTTTTFE